LADLSRSCATGIAARRSRRFFVLGPRRRTRTGKSLGIAHGPLRVMARAGRPSTSLPRSTQQDVDGGSAPTMRWRDKCSIPNDVPIFARRLTRFPTAWRRSCDASARAPACSLPGATRQRQSTKC